MGTWRLAYTMYMYTVTHIRNVPKYSFGPNYSWDGPNYSAVVGEAQLLLQVFYVTVCPGKVH